MAPAWEVKCNKVKSSQENFEEVIRIYRELHFACYWCLPDDWLFNPKYVAQLCLEWLNKIVFMVSPSLPEHNEEWPLSEESNPVQKNLQQILIHCILGVPYMPWRVWGPYLCSWSFPIRHLWYKTACPLNHSHTHHNLTHAVKVKVLLHSQV